jgi:L-fuconolactonase
VRYVYGGVGWLWATADRLGIAVNVNTNRQKRAEIETLARRHPGLKVVLDHCLYLSAGPDGQAVLADLLQLSRLPNLYAKLSCAVTGSAESFPFRDMHAPLRRAIAAFGPDRCVWGSDFPCELWCPKATYSEHLRVFTRELGLDAETQRWILGETARRLYF